MKQHLDMHNGVGVFIMITASGADNVIALLLGFPRSEIQLDCSDLGSHMTDSLARKVI